MALDPSRNASVRYAFSAEIRLQQTQAPGNACCRVGGRLFDRCCTRDKASVNSLGQMPYNDVRNADVDAAQSAISRSAHNRLGADRLPLGIERADGVRDGTQGIRGQADEIRRQAAYGALGKLDANKVDGDAMRLLQDVTQRYGDKLDSKELDKLKDLRRVSLDDAQIALADAFRSQGAKSSGLDDYLTVKGNRAAELDGSKAREENYQTLGAIRANRNVSNTTMNNLQRAVEAGGLDSKTLAKYLDKAGTTITQREADLAVERSRQQHEREQGSVYA